MYVSTVFYLYMYVCKCDRHSNVPTSKCLSPRLQSVLDLVEPGDVVIIESGDYFEDLKTRVSGKWYVGYYLH